MDAFANVITIFSRKFFEFIQTYKRRTNAMTPCRIPEFAKDIK